MRRPMNAEEQSENERSVVNTRDALREVSITQTVKGDKQVDRTYSFDQVFGAHAAQVKASSNRFSMSRAGIPNFLRRRSGQGNLHRPS